MVMHPTVTCNGCSLKRIIINHSICSSDFYSEVLRPLGVPMVRGPGRHWTEDSLAPTTVGSKIRAAALLPFVVGVCLSCNWGAYNPEA